MGARGVMVNQVNQRCFDIFKKQPDVRNSGYIIDFSTFSFSGSIPLFFRLSRILYANRSLLTYVFPRILN